MLVGIGRAFGAVTGITGAVNAFNGLLSNVGGLKHLRLFNGLSNSPLRRQARQQRVARHRGWMHASRRTTSTSRRTSTRAVQTRKRLCA